jgi:hypothetical protein
MKQTVHDLDAEAEWEYTARRLTKCILQIEAILEGYVIKGGSCKVCPFQITRLQKQRPSVLRPQNWLA